MDLKRQSPKFHQILTHTLKPSLHIVFFSFRRSFRVVGSLSLFGSLSDFYLVIPNSQEQWVVSSLTRSLFPYDFFGRLRSLGIFSGLPSRNDFYSNDGVFLGRRQSFVLVSIWSFTVVRKLLRP